MKNNIKRIIIAVLLSVFIIGCTIIMRNRDSDISVDQQVKPRIEPEINLNDSTK